jgi:hypothetical protein
MVPGNDRAGQAGDKEKARDEQAEPAMNNDPQLTH